jgi:hypothetical protein
MGSHAVPIVRIAETLRLCRRTAVSHDGTICSAYTKQRAGVVLGVLIVGSDDLPTNLAPWEGDRM